MVFKDRSHGRFQAQLQRYGVTADFVDRFSQSLLADNVIVFDATNYEGFTRSRFTLPQQPLRERTIVAMQTNVDPPGCSA